MPTDACDGSALSVAHAARSGGTATGTPTAAAGPAEANGATVVFTCSHSAATAAFTCADGDFGAPIFSSGDACPAQ